MLFNSYVFICVFLPIVLVGYYIIGAVTDKRLAKAWLVSASAVFYGWWSVPFLGMLFISILFNFYCGQRLLQLSKVNPPRARSLLTLSVIANLILLGYFKYATFFAVNLSALTGIDVAIHGVVLPLAISFYTFQQIAYLVDCRTKIINDHNFIDYTLFVLFFPQLIAGPIVHHSEMMPQFQQKAFKFRHEYFSVGIAFFMMGLVKKVLIADTVSGFAEPIFEHGGVQNFGLFESWLAVFAATVGIYFDFSGYSDMAIGLGRMFGIKLPYNFNSPYKARSIIDFWRRWHITLSRFLRDYVYIPLGGSRQGEARRVSNLMLTMLLGGLWHGAGWTFVVWGGLHGFYLLVNRLWQVLQARLASRGINVVVPVVAARLLTIAAVMLAWIFFYASSFEQAAEVLQGMIGLNGHDTMFSGAVASQLAEGGSARRDAVINLLVLVVGFGMALFAPNTQEIIDGKLGTTSTNRLVSLLSWRPNGAWAAVTVVVVVFVLTRLSNVKEFVYFQF